MQVLTPNFPANPYFGSDVEAQAAERVDPTGPQSLLGYKFKRRRTINWSVQQPLLLFIPQVCLASRRLPRSGALYRW